MTVESGRAGELGIPFCGPVGSSEIFTLRSDALAEQVGLDIFEALYQYDELCQGERAKRSGDGPSGEPLRRQNGS
ncbi:MAG: hypothetical protein JO368_11910 [Acidimicrobiales bacterium]|nr:hypothetical protein [Acidimicrobiales bacterium]